MKVGILSMQRVINYGSLLQACALRKTLSSLGLDVVFVDIRNGTQLVRPSNKKTVKFVLERIFDKYLFRRISRRFYYKKRLQQFVSEWQPAIGITTPSSEEECDAIIVGSDEVFNCTQSSSFGFSTQLFGDVRCPLVASYAGSFGYTNYEDLCRFHIDKEIATSLKKMKSISVRDENSANCMEKLVGKRPFVHLDPVLIYNFEKEIPQSVPFKNYILIYSYDNRINDKKEIDAIKKFAKEQGKKTISFGLYQNWCDLNVLVDPFTLLACFDAADYVITDTFHGSVFSIKRNKQFAVLIRDSNRNKLSDLLERFDLTSRSVSAVSRLGSVLQTPIDYKPINWRLQKESERSVSYLKTTLGLNND